MFFRDSCPLRRTGLLAASAVLAAFAATPSARASTTYGLAEMFNEWDVPNLDPLTNSFGPTGIEIDFQGNAVGCIPAQTTDGWTNPWEAWHELNSGLAVNATHIVFHASGSYTSVTLSGSALAVPPLTDIWHGGTFPGPTWGNGGGLSYHPGVNAGFAGAVCPNNPVIWKRWIYAKRGLPTQYQTIPLGGVSWPGGLNQKNVNQALGAVLYFEITAPGAQEPGATGTWYRTNYVPAQDGTPPTFLYTNNGADPITLGVVGVQTGIAESTDKTCTHNPRCKENQKILDQLNAQYYLPPNNEGSPMTALPQLQGITVQPGQSVKVGLQ